MQDSLRNFTNRSYSTNVQPPICLNDDIREASGSKFVTAKVDDGANQNTKRTILVKKNATILQERSPSN